MSLLEVLGGVAFGVAVFIAYFLPSFIADYRDCQAKWAIIIVNVLFGFTLVGWVGALVWALVGKTRERQAMESAALASAVKTGSTSTADELEKLVALRDRGVISEQEFAAQKAKLLSS